MITAFIEKNSTRTVVDTKASQRLARLKHSISNKNKGLSLTRSEEFLDGTHDIFDILVMQDTKNMNTGET